VSRPTTDALAERLASYDAAVEVGIGRRTDVAAALVDHVTDPDPAVYAGGDLVYALNAPPELHRPLRDAARDADADLLFTTLGGDPPAIPVERETLPRETLFRAKRGPGVE